MSNILLGLVGDLLADRDLPEEGFSDVLTLLAEPEILFGNLEANFTDNPHPSPSVGIPVIPPSHNLDVFSRVGFDVLSMANNHIVDAGHEVMLENRERLRSQGVKTCGAGINLADARKPAIVEAGGVRVAFLAYASVFPTGYEARSNVPGLAPVRAYDLWRPALDNYHVPGTVPIIETVPDRRDMAALGEDIANARQQSDIVITSFHWGDYMRPYHLTDHETRTARWCIDNGADMVVGHHHHALRGMEWYRNKPIMYGLGHFVFDLRLKISDEFLASYTSLSGDAQEYTVFPREGWPLLPLHEDTRMTVFAWATANKEGIQDIGFVPCQLQPDGRVLPVDPDSTEGASVVGYLERCIESQKLNGRISREMAPTLAGLKTLRIVARD